MPDSHSPRSSRQKPGGTDSMLARAGIQAGDGAGRLFDRLDAMNTRLERASQLFTRLAERLRDGEWTPEVAALVAQAEALERMLDATAAQPPRDDNQSVRRLLAGRPSPPAPPLKGRGAQSARSVLAPPLL